MTADPNASTATYPAQPRRGDLSLSERLERLEEGQAETLRLLRDNASYQIRIRALEAVVYGACGLGLLSLCVALVGKVVKA